MPNSCTECGLFHEPDGQYPFGGCLVIKKISKRLNISPTSLQYHGLGGCSSWEAKKRPIPTAPAKKQAPDPITDENLPF